MANVVLLGGSCLSSCVCEEQNMCVSVRVTPGLISSLPDHEFPMMPLWSGVANLFTVCCSSPPATSNQIVFVT